LVNLYECLLSDRGVMVLSNSTKVLKLIEVQKEHILTYCNASKIGVPGKSIKVNFAITPERLWPKVKGVFIENENGFR